MRSIVHDRYGPDPAQVLRLADVATPTIGADDVLVRVHAAAVDRSTWHLMAGRPYPMRLAYGLRRPKPANPGRSVAGTVAAVGAAVRGLRPGDEVYGFGAGAFAEAAPARPARLARKPAGLTFAEAAAMPNSGLTALQAVRDHGRVTAGQSVLVVGASGSVGSHAVQIARAAGAEVTGVARTAKLDAVRALGAHHVIDHTAEDITTGGRRFDVILDIGGNRTLRHLRRALAPTGRLVIIGGEGGGPWLGGIDRQLRAVLWSPFLRQHLGMFVATETTADLDALRDLVDAGQVRPLVDRCYPLEETAAAVGRLVAGDAVGTIVVTL